MCEECLQRLSRASHDYSYYYQLREELEVTCPRDHSG